MVRGSTTKKAIVKPKKMRVYFNEEIPDQPFPELTNYEDIQYRPEKLGDINRGEGQKLTGIDASGNLIKEVINAKLDTSTKEILGDFTFGASGAIKMITDANNGLWLSPTGILGKKAGATTFSITTTGDATFAGTLSAVTGTLGTLTIDASGYIKGGQTAFKTGDGIFMGYDTTNELDQWYEPTTNLSDKAFADGSTSKVGEHFVVTQGIINLKEVKVYLKKVSANTNIIYCDIYEADTNYKPTGASLGQTSIAGITNSAYEEKTFTFSTAITITNSKHYCFILSSPETSTGIHIKHQASPYGTYGGGGLLSYIDSWDYSRNSDVAFKTYAQNTGYKFSVGNSDYQFSYNTQNVYFTSALLVRENAHSDYYASYGSGIIEIYQKGYVATTLYPSAGLEFFHIKELTSGRQQIVAITPYYTASNDVFDYAGIEIKSGVDNSTMRFSDKGLLVSNSIGNSNNKQIVYCEGLSACPLPTVDNALQMLDKIKTPKEKSKLSKPEHASFEYEDKTKKRKYFDDIDFPDELTFLNDKGEKDIELIRIIGFLVKSTMELNEEIKLLKTKIK